MLKFSSLIRRFLAGGDGSVTVEFVAALPMLIGALAFCYEFGRAFLAYEIATSDVQSAVRYLSHIPPTASGLPNPNYFSMAQNIAMCGSPTGTCSPQSAHWPWNEGGAAPVVAVVYCTQIAMCTSCNNIGQNCQPFNQDITELQVRGDIQMTLSLLGIFGLGKIYTMHVVDKTMWIGS
jgi:hypothetical protein